ncbi:hypothetical protein HYC85_009625 [Camellia sinensis]|uniref:Uncharacterized protein n=1 Tax=Camellia sinensis TaxID=4442 RepID=A0A7J7HHD6_CAMSI|nr:hypothetical protein HYC85_009625 [Camellia sinensis]
MIVIAIHHHCNPHDQIAAIATPSSSDLGFLVVVTEMDELRERKRRVRYSGGSTGRRFWNERRRGSGGRRGKRDRAHRESEREERKRERELENIKAFGKEIARRRLPAMVRAIMVKRYDGFTFGLAFSTKESFIFNKTQLSPCDRRLFLAGSTAQLAMFRPKVGEISLLTLNGTQFNPNMTGGYMVAFAGRQYAARSVPIFVVDMTNTVTSFTLVLEFQKGTLQNLYWKKFGCASCTGKSVTAIPTSNCKGSGGAVDCNLGIQLAFSGTDKNEEVLNSWYEVANLRQYSLFALYSNLRETLTGPFGNLF